MQCHSQKKHLYFHSILWSRIRSWRAYAVLLASYGWVLCPTEQQQSLRTGKRPRRTLT